jgi:RNA recognition motif-containing protein
LGKKLYVGNLSYEITQEDLKGLFAQAGTCQSVTVVMDRATGRSRGFGFVEMSSSAEAQKAMQQLNGHDLKGRALRVNEAMERNDQGGNDRGRSWNRRY